MRRPRNRSIARETGRPIVSGDTTRGSTGMPPSSLGSTPARRQRSASPSPLPPSLGASGVRMPLGPATSRPALRRSFIRRKNAVARMSSPGDSALKSPMSMWGSGGSSAISVSTAPISRIRRASPLLRSPNRAARCRQCTPTKGISAPPVSISQWRWERSIRPWWRRLRHARIGRRVRIAVCIGDAGSLGSPRSISIPSSPARSPTVSTSRTSWRATTSASTRRRTLRIRSRRRSPPRRML